MAVGVIDFLLKRWTPDSLKLEACNGIVSATAPCGEMRWLTADDAERLANRLLAAARVARENASNAPPLELPAHESVRATN